MTDTTLPFTNVPAAVALPGNSMPSTYFAPPERDATEELARKAAEVQAAPYLCEALDAMPQMVLILNENRQVVAANRAALAALNAAACDAMGKRPGEAVGCIRAKEGPNGCGTSRHCANCGAVNAILESQSRKEKVVHECRITVAAPTGTAALDLRATASPLEIDGDRLVVLAVEDVSESKRLGVLQRIFFHDVLNTAGCVQGYSEYLLDVFSDGENRDVCKRLSHLAGGLIEAIQSQRDLVYAESGELKPEAAPVSCRRVLSDLATAYEKHPLAEGRAIQIRCYWDGTVTADRHLLERVLGNMLKNALEATTLGNTVNVECHRQGDEAIFSVRNAEAMPEAVQLQVFQRSFSTKGEAGRGIGTHSMKLLGERYLGGGVGFTSNESEGTTFWLSLPVHD